MAVLGIDLGGTKLASALFAKDGSLILKEIVQLQGFTGHGVGKLITDQILAMIIKAECDGHILESIGISVPGISNSRTGKVWAPNIKGWEEYPLLEEVKEISGEIPAVVDSDRACSILGEVWMGNAMGCRNAVFLAVGTGIGAGILINGEVLRGNNDIAGAIGWMALDRPFESKYIDCGCFEYYASGEGIARVAREILKKKEIYSGELAARGKENINAHDLFIAYENHDPVASEVIGQCIEFWGMAAANIISLFNPEKIIFGGGVFGPAVKLIPAIREEASKWAQPVSFKKVTFEQSGLGSEAAVYGAGFIALKIIQK